jgi:predicted DNA-binding antitoxin AbrB/MazE fold protein
MGLEVEAVYEKGVLKPVRDLPLAEGERVRLEIHAVESHARRTAGLIPWPPQFPLNYFEKDGEFFGPPLEDDEDKAGPS